MVARAEIDRLRATIPIMERNLQTAKEALKNHEARCQHQWLPTTQGTKPVLEYRAGRLIQQGSDMWHEQVPYTNHVPCWRRECKVCGKVEETTATQEKVTAVPRF